MMPRQGPGQDSLLGRFGHGVGSVTCGRRNAVHQLLAHRVTAQRTISLSV